MASSLSNGLSSQRSPNTSYVHDIPIVPHQPAVYKEYKEIVPDISVVSDIVDNESPAENFRGASQEVPKLSKYFLQGELTSETLPLNKSSLLRRNIYTEKHVQHTSCEHNLGINSCFSKPKPTFDSANKIEDYLLLSKHPSCQCHAMNEIASERWNEQFSLPHSKCICISSPRTSNEGKIERELNCSIQNGECLLNKKECKYSETFEKLNPCTDHNSTFKDNGHFSSEIIPNLPLTCTQKIQDCCCSKKQSLKSNRNCCEHEKHVSFDIELRKTDNPEKKQESKISYSNSDTTSRNCKKKNCQCQSKTKKLNLNSSKNAADSSTSDEHASENEKVSVSTNELLNIWEYIKQQDEKINSLQEQVKILTENSSCGHKFSIEEIDSSNTMESDVPYILNILEVHGDKIQELQNQISSLSIIDMKSSDISNNENMFKEVQSRNSENKNTCSENAEQAKASTFVTNTVCCEQVQVTKTSASTMTSLTFENNDKLVYHKQFTVVTDLKHTKEMPAGCEVREGKASVRKNHLNKKGLVSSSRKKKDHNSEKHSPNLKLNAKKQVTSSSSSDIPTSNDVQELRTPLQCKKDSSPRVLKKKEKHVNERILDNDQDRHKKRSPGQKTTPKSQLRHSKQKQRQHTYPKLVDTPVAKISKKQTVQHKSSSSSNTSTDSIYQSPEHKQIVLKDRESEQSGDSDQYEPQKFLSRTELDDDNHTFEESATISRYGLSSPNLSVATQRYLENYGLVHDKNNPTKSRRKTRTSLSKRYIS
ncbi:uncharacterized protein TNCT_101882 [Trichonephila clavata]|uniref:Uncharacterized protein n=1 Tax=Trichonephila clavata TaxID=2740835 RepID=A0A8X6GCE6_TRICU|nr:uncharacterized protein TNCT_101882 [Trichonephila clavata]